MSIAAARQCVGGVIARLSAPSTTVAPHLRSSAAIAASRSVSLTRQLAMLVSRVVPSANRASAASVIAASGMWLQSSVIGASGKRPRRTTSELSSVSIDAPIERAASTKAMSPWIDSSPTPSMRRPGPLAAIAPAAMKYDADDASASTAKRPGERSACAPARRKRCQPSRSTAMPKRSSRRSVIAM